MSKSKTKKAEVPLTRSEIMQRVKQKDTAGELSLRSALHESGLRYRLHRRIEGVMVDVVFVSAKIAIFVDGCFWHGCPIHTTLPKSNQTYWLPKLAENKERDLRQTVRLRAAGWCVIRLWEHECLPTTPKTIRRIQNAVSRHPRNKGSINAR